VTDEAGGRRRRSSYAERRAERATVEDPAQVLDAAARFLEARPRSTAEVRRRLSTMGYRAALVDETLSRLTELGYLDDEAFARSWVASRDRARPRGAHALRRELQLKGVDRELIDEVLGDRETEAGTGAAAAFTSADEAAAERLLTKKLPSLLREPDPRKRLQKAYALLARSGFPPDVCSTVSRRVLADPSPDEPSR
jgi:regulatory protein